MNMTRPRKRQDTLRGNIFIKNHLGGFNNRKKVGTGMVKIMIATMANDGDRAN